MFVLVSNFFSQLLVPYLFLCPQIVQQLAKQPCANTPKITYQIIHGPLILLVLTSRSASLHQQDIKWPVDDSNIKYHRRCIRVWLFGIGDQVLNVVWVLLQCQTFSQIVSAYQKP